MRIIPEEKGIVVRLENLADKFDYGQTQFVNVDDLFKNLYKEATGKVLSKYTIQEMSIDGVTTIDKISYKG